ncbi:Nucleoporin [Erysiphe necator]|uniref:Nucleoporin NSP1 n=1 Tax=Uncinula necator TaxID=52586 RepID=A0A0B1PB82_UNCNE|nr:Nucleoporin [Erysiphe necator]KHJ35508.1 putative nuclear pore glycoprotein p62 [Erysiphe necator]
MESKSNPTGGGSNIFGQNKSLFGVPASQNKSPLFGQTSTASTGAATETTNNNSQGLFSGISTSKPETSSTQSLFSKPTGAATGGLFSIPSTSGGFNFGGNSASTLGTENKPVTSFAPSFGGLQAKKTLVPSTSTTGEVSGGALTPAKPFSFNASTTPAGPPPKNNISGSSLFGNGITSSESKLSGNGSESKSLFGKGSSTLFGAPKSNSESNSSAASEVQKPSSMTSTNTDVPSSVAQSIESSSTLKAPLSSEQTSSGSSSKPDIFQNLSNNTTSSAPTTTLNSAAFSFPSAVGTKRSAPASKNTTSTENLTNQTSDTTTQAKTTTAEAEKSVNAPSFGSSTVGPTPQLTRLKNKTMDEIITRWASDLSKYQKEFQEQAIKVAAWDRLMVENGEKIQKLYLSTFEAERQNTEIERQLLNVENQQDEVASWLDKYESEIDEMFSRQIGQGEIVQGPDQEREKTYKLAEKLTDRLDDMAKNLTSMINAINDASTVLSKTGKADDPLSSIVRVLNNHLTTLQWIDENAEALKSKIEESQKVGKNIGSNGLKGLESESADYFYRSLMGRK